MNFFNNMRVSARLMSGFGLLIAALVVVSSVALFQLTAINASLHELVDNRLCKVQIYSKLKANLLTVAAITRDVVLLNDAAAAVRQIEQILALRPSNAKIFAELGKTVTSPKGMELLKIINDNRGAYSKLLDQTMKLGRSGNPEDLKAAGACWQGRSPRSKN